MLNFSQNECYICAASQSGAAYAYWVAALMRLAQTREVHVLDEGVLDIIWTQNSSVRDRKEVGTHKQYYIKIQELFSHQNILHEMLITWSR